MREAFRGEQFLAEPGDELVGVELQEGSVLLAGGADLLEEDRGLLPTALLGQVLGEAENCFGVVALVCGGGGQRGGVWGDA